MEPCPPIVIVVAMSRTNRAIGNNNQLLWHIPDDMKRFKTLTLGHPIIMGKNTFLSIVEILGKPLPGRTNIVLTRDERYVYEGVKVAHSLVEAVELAKKESPSEIHIGGGAELYRQTLPLVTRLHVTYVHDEPIADTFFPAFEDEFQITNQHETAKYENLTYQWVDYERKFS
ncbi:MAG: dihydrofolate reductase [Candidatus Pacebacteria bacterium]|nr:dihydrofolate reductase [Candidatus Paceibacterota bacterium]MBP9842809.1 dihydrofolate reductase [Candidatus Paceibacterota bacterium]